MSLTGLDLAAGATTSYGACPWWPGSVDRLGRTLTPSPQDRFPANRQLGRCREQREAVAPQQGITACLGYKDHGNGSSDGK